MTFQQAGILAILAMTALLFISGRWRHDLVALGALVTCVVVGFVDPAEAFAGFGNPAVITVASVLILSFALQTTGVVDTLTARVLPSNSGSTASIIALSALAAGLSAFMNNVGALALLMPIAIKTASRLGLSPGRVLMPLSFASILGGMTTLTGTPPNLIVAGFSGQGDSSAFTMFDFAPVGLAVTAGGLLLIALGWRLVPARERSNLSSFETAPYIIEARVKQESPIIGQSLRDIEYQLDTTDAQIVGLLREDKRISAPSPYREVRGGDILVIEADPESIGDALSKLGLTLDTIEKAKEEKLEEKERAEKSDKVDQEGDQESRLQSGDVILMELAVRPNALLLGLTIKLIELRREFGVNLIALSRDGKESMARLNSTPIRSGDVLLVQGNSEAILEFANRYGCVPLAERPLKIPNTGKAFLAAAIMVLAICGAAFGLLPAAITFAAGVLAVAVFKVVPLRKLYEPIDWPVIVLLGALIPVAGAMSTTGAADLVAQGLIKASGGNSPIYTMIILLVVTMTLSD
ncbi:MAG: SLC13 family permease, partial [Hyphomonas sp. 32-62-5]